MTSAKTGTVPSLYIGPLGVKPSVSSRPGPSQVPAILVGVGKEAFPGWSGQGSIPQVSGTEASPQLCPYLAFLTGGQVWGGPDGIQGPVEESQRQGSVTEQNHPDLITHLWAK